VSVDRIVEIFTNGGVFVHTNRSYELDLTPPVNEVPSLGDAHSL